MLEVGTTQSVFIYEFKDGFWIEPSYNIQYILDNKICSGNQNLRVIETLVYNFEFWQIWKPKSFTVEKALNYFYLDVSFN